MEEASRDGWEVFGNANQFDTYVQCRKLDRSDDIADEYARRLMGLPPSNDKVSEAELNSYVHKVEENRRKSVMERNLQDQGFVGKSNDKGYVINDSTVSLWSKMDYFAKQRYAEARKMSISDFEKEIVSYMDSKHADSEANKTEINV